MPPDPYQLVYASSWEGPKDWTGLQEEEDAPVNFRQLEAEEVLDYNAPSCGARVALEPINIWHCPISAHRIMFKLTSLKISIFL